MAATLAAKWIPYLPPPWKAIPELGWKWHLESMSQQNPMDDTSGIGFQFQLEMSRPTWRCRIIWNSPSKPLTLNINSLITYHLPYQVNSCNAVVRLVDNRKYWVCLISISYPTSQWLYHRIPPHQSNNVGLPMVGLYALIAASAAVEWIPTIRQNSYHLMSNSMIFENKTPPIIKYMAVLEDSL